MNEPNQSTVDRLNDALEKIADACDGMEVTEMISILHRLIVIVCLEHDISKEKLLMATSLIYDLMSEEVTPNDQPTH